MLKRMYAEHPSPSPLIRSLWEVDVTHDGSWVSPADEFWGLVFGVDRGERTAELVGPSLDPRPMSATAGGRFWGVEFEAHVFWHGLDKADVLGAIHLLPSSGDGGFVLAGTRVPFTPLDGLEALVETLVARGVIVAEPLVALALRPGGPVPGSERTVRRRVRHVTGLGRKQVQQLQRARTAYRLLQLGTPLAAAAAEAGFADQAHMTRSLRVFAGRTPARILRGEG